MSNPPLFTPEHRQTLEDNVRKLEVVFDGKSTTADAIRAVLAEVERLESGEGCKRCNASVVLADVLAALKSYEPKGPKPPGGCVRYVRWVCAALQADAVYHRDCRPNRLRAEAAYADNKALNDRIADLIVELRNTQAERDQARAEADRLRQVILAMATDLESLNGQCLFDPAVRATIDRLRQEQA